jgi:hypothetical protein
MTKIEQTVYRMLYAYVNSVREGSVDDAITSAVRVLRETFKCIRRISYALFVNSLN